MSEPMKHIVNFSFGESSWATGKLVAQRYGAENTILLFADTLIEDEDTYAWGQAAAENIGAPLVRVVEGRDPWDVFFAERMMGNSRTDLCSRILKRDVLDDWLATNCDPANTTCYVGISAWEADRFCRFDDEKQQWRGVLHRLCSQGWFVRAPLCEEGWGLKLGLDKGAVRDWCQREGLWVQRLYTMGFSHANCGGFCVKAGHTHFLDLLKHMPERFAYHERREQEFREFVGADVSILKDRRGGETNVLTLKDLRERHEKEQYMPLFDWGGCGCFSGADV